MGIWGLMGEGSVRQEPAVCQAAADAAEGYQKPGVSTEATGTPACAGGCQPWSGGGGAPCSGCPRGSGFPPCSGSGSGYGSEAAGTLLALPSCACSAAVLVHAACHLCMKGNTGACQQ